MLNELDNRIKLISDISPIPENEQKLRDELQLLYMTASVIVSNNLNESVRIRDLVRVFAKDRLNKLDNTKILNIKDLPMGRCDLNITLLRIFKKLDKERGRISFFSKTDKVFVLANEKAMKILFERLMCFLGERINVEVKGKRIKIKSDCSFSELTELRNCKSDSMLVINKILNLHSSAMFIYKGDNGSEISISLDGMLCNETDYC